MSCRQLKMYFLASLDLSPVSFSCSSVVWRKNRNMSCRIYSMYEEYVKDFLSESCLNDEEFKLKEYDPIYKKELGGKYVSFHANLCVQSVR